MSLILLARSLSPFSRYLASIVVLVGQHVFTIVKSRSQFECTIMPQSDLAWLVNLYSIFKGGQI